MAKTLSVAERLEKAVSDYLLWMTSNGYADSTCMRYRQILTYFFPFYNPTGNPMGCCFYVLHIKRLSKRIRAYPCIACGKGTFPVSV